MYKRLGMLVILFLCFMFQVKTVDAADYTIWVGDKRTAKLDDVMGMSKNMNTYVITDNGADLKWLKNTGKTKLNAKYKAILKEDETANIKVFMWLGAEDIKAGDNNAKSYITFMKKWVSPKIKEDTKAHVYFINISGGKSKKKVEFKNFKKAANFNGTLNKEVVGVKGVSIIDVATYVHTEKDTNPKTKDGFIYTDKMYTKIYSFITDLKLTTSEGKSDKIDESASEAQAQLTKKQITGYRNACGLASDDKYGKVKAWYAAMLVVYTPEAAAGMMGNMYGESSNYDSDCQYDVTWGLFQWDDGKMKDYKKWCSSKAHKKMDGCKNVTRFGVSGMCINGTCQVTFMVTSDNVKNRINSIHWSKNYESVREKTSEVKSDTVCPDDFKYSEYKNYADFKKGTNVKHTTLKFYLDYESAGATSIFWDKGVQPSIERSPTKFVTNYTKRYNAADAMYHLFTGVAGSDANESAEAKKSKQAEAKALATQAGNSWSESELAAYCKLTEIDLSEVLAEATKDKLSQDEVSGLVGWKDNIDADSEDSSIIVWGRRITMLIGILFSVWVILIYIAFWFDRINNFIDLNALGILTFGKLKVSDSDDECTFGLKELTKEHDGGMTVNHRCMLMICITALAFAVFIISGRLFLVLHSLVDFVRGIQ